MCSEVVQLVEPERTQKCISTHRLDFAWGFCKVNLIKTLTARLQVVQHCLPYMEKHGIQMNQNPH